MRCRRGRYVSVADYLILVIIAVSTLIGIWRGFVREAMSLVIWVAAFWIAYTWAGDAEVWFTDWSSDRALRVVTAFVALFLLVHVVGFLISRLLALLLESIGLGGVNRVAGGGFGVARGVLLVAAVVLVVQMTPLREAPLWQQSYMIGLFSDGLAWVQERYPLDTGKLFYSSGAQLNLD